MDIYKLKDQVREGSASGIAEKGGFLRQGRNRGENSEGSASKITGLKQGVKNPNRVNVFIDGKYAFSLDVAQVVDLGVKIGLEVDTEKIEELKKASEFGKVYQRALEWALARPRSEREVRDYLRRRERTAEMKEKQREWQDLREEKPVRKRKKAEYDFDELVIQRLKDGGYLDDKRFAEYYVENRFVKKGVSAKRLKMELVGKGVDMDVIDEVIGGRSDEEEIDKIIERKRGKYDDEKLIAYLCRQGFPYELARNRVLSGRG